MADVAKTLEDEGVASFSKSFDELHAVAHRQGQRPGGGSLTRGGPTMTDDAAVLIERLQSRDARCGRTGNVSANRLGWLDVPRRMASEAADLASWAAGHRPVDGGPARHGRLLARPRRARGGPGRHGDARRSGDRPPAAGGLRHHPPGHGVGRRLLRRLRAGVVQVGDDARAERPLRPRLVPAARPDPLRRHHRPRDPVGQAGRRAGLRPLLREPARHRRPLLGAVLLRHGPGRAHRLRRRRTLRPGPRPPS